MKTAFFILYLIILYSKSSHAYQTDNSNTNNRYLYQKLYRSEQNESFLNRLIFPLKLKHMKETSYFFKFF